MDESPGLTLLIAIAALYFLRKIYIRLRLSRAKHPSLRGHAKWSRRMAKLVAFFEYREDKFYGCDGAPADVQESRRQGLDKLSKNALNAAPQTSDFSTELEDSISDVRFTRAYRVPFPFRNCVPKALTLSPIVTATKGVKMQDMDGNWRIDLSGSYGVNVFGYDFYKECMAAGMEKVKDVGPVLGPYHPVIKENVAKLKTISGLDEVSFHMSGTEAVMQAVRLARYHTGRSHLVRLCGAYHGWWDGVQPGVGNQRKVNDVYTLNDLSPNTLKVLETRNDIACILINPMQAFNPNADAASDTALIASDRAVNFDKARYTEWLRQIRDICTRRGIVLIFDEVFTGFRLSYRGAQGYYGIQADMVTYGKTLGGGYPIGALCGRADLMKRYKDQQPANPSLARGTFNSHPYVLAAMNEFLHRIEAPEIQAQYETIETLWNQRVEKLNATLAEHKLPVRLANMHTVLTTLYTVPSRFNWMFQFYLRDEGVELAWIGTGRMIMSFNFSDDDFAEVIDCFVRAATRMQADGWWWQSPNLNNKAIKREFLRDMIVARIPALENHFQPGLLPSNQPKGQTSNGPSV